jgi:hypothetical protein
MMISRLLDLIEMRRAEISDRERQYAAKLFDRIPESQRAFLPPDVRG